jgi:hypothetical protein
LACPTPATVSTAVGEPEEVDPEPATLPGECEFAPTSESPDGKLVPGTALVSVMFYQSDAGTDMYNGDTNPSTPVTGLGKKAKSYTTAGVTNVDVLTASGAMVSVGINRTGGPSAGDLTLAENLARTMIT